MNVQFEKTLTAIIVALLLTFAVSVTVPPAHAAYDVTIWTWDSVVGWPQEPITMDGNPTGFNSPHTFPGLTGAHTFTVPLWDDYNGMFGSWDTGETSTTITVSTGGTYTARYYPLVILPFYDVTIWTWDSVYGWPSEPITKDGVATGFNSPHTFTMLTGTHTFTVPNTDSQGNVFSQWDTGETSRTITVSSAGTYTAQYYPLIIIPISDFTVSASPASQTVTAGQSTTYTVTVASLGIFTGYVNMGSSGWPPGATLSWSPQARVDNAPGTLTLTVSTTSATPAGTYTLTINGIGDPGSHSTTVTLVVNSAAPPPPTPDFTVSATPSSQTVNQGQSTTYTVNVGSVGGFTGGVSLTVTGLPTGATGSFNPTTLNPTVTGASTLTVTTTSQTPAGTYTLTITGTWGTTTHSTTVTLVVNSAAPPPPTPDFTVSASPASGTTTQGQSTTYTVTVGSVGGFSTGVALTVTGLPTGATGTFSPSTVTPTGTSTLTITTTSQTPAGTSTLTITGTAGATTHSTTATLTITSAAAPTSPDFTVSASPTSRTVSQGLSTTCTVTVTSVGGFSTAVSLSITGLPAGATGSFTPSTVTPTGTSTLNVATTSQTPAATTTLTITGTAGTITHSTTMTLTVSSVAQPAAPPDFSMSATPTSGTAAQGQSAAYTVTVGSLNGFSQDVSLGVTGLPAGATATFSSPTIYSTGTATLTITAASSTPAGIYPLTITGTGAGLTHQATISFTVTSTPPPPTTPDFSISASPTSQTINQGESTTYTVNAASVGGFSTSVPLTVTGLPTGASGTFNPTAITPTGTSTLTVTTTSQTPAATSTLTITGTAGTTTHSATVTLTVSSVAAPPTSPDFTVSASPASQTISQMQFTTYSVNVASIGGFSTGVSLGVTGLPAGATGSFNPSAVSPTGASTLTVATTSQTPAGTTILTITGASGTTTHFTTVTLTVSAPSAPAPSSKTNSAITLSVSPTEFQVGSDVVLKGAVQPAREAAVVTIETLSTGVTWNPLATVTTSIDGTYTYIWKPTDEGTYLVRASWPGDANTTAGQSESITLHATAQTVTQTPSPTFLQTVPLWVFAVVVGGILVVTVAAVIASMSSKRRKNPPPAY